jgi:uncharacterized protein (TIGR02284 family)
MDISKNLNRYFMSMYKELTSLLNDLVRINHDRTEGYQKAVEELKPTDIDLKTMFNNMANHSTQFSSELKEEITKFGGEPASDSTQSGKIYRVWMDIRSSVSDHDRKSILDLCEFGEDAALKAYKAAIESDVEIPAEVRQLIEAQRANIKTAHDVVKRYRDMHEAIEH